MFRYLWTLSFLMNQGDAQYTFNYIFSVKKRLLIDFSASYTERNFITPMRAMTEYLLKQSDLESLPKVLRRSPYESAPPITVYYRKDVEAKAIEVCITIFFYT